MADINAGDRRSKRPQAEDESDGTWTRVADSFVDMNLNEDVLRGVFASGFETPSYIQRRAIVPCIEGHDVIAQSQSGTGKTATFVIPVLQRIDASRSETQALILTPTRELAKQIWNVVITLGEFTGVRCHACVGGTSVEGDVKALRSKAPHVVAGTPGRVFDMLTRGSLSAGAVKTLVLDEADRMLGPGLKDQISDIFARLPPNVQTILLSATMPADALEAALKFTRDPKRILVKKEELTLEGIRQFYVNAEKEELKLETLCDLYGSLQLSQAVIFLNTRRKAEWLTRRMTSRDFTVSLLHGEMDQRERDEVMKEFRSGSSRVLVTTDLLARGIDVRRVSVVINYDLPTNLENYIHRIGRGGRFGGKGVAINMITEDSCEALAEIQRFYGTQVEELPMDMNRFF